MNEYILFVDETLKTSNNPYFCLSGVCIERNYYEHTLTEQINTFKKTNFSSTDVIFHYSEMNNKKGKFGNFADSDFRNKFWNDFSSLLRSLNFTTFGVYFEQARIQALYCNKTIKAYNIAFIELLNNFLHYLKNVNGVGSVCIESRSFKENEELQRIYYAYLSNGSIYFAKDDFDKYLSTIGFIVKGDNCIGLQIADIAPSALLRKVNNRKDSYNIGQVYRDKLYCANSCEEEMLGLKRIC